MILNLTCAVSEWYFFFTLFLPTVTDFSKSVKLLQDSLNDTTA